jgi:hypothetical protein
MICQRMLQQHMEEHKISNKVLYELKQIDQSMAIGPRKWHLPLSLSLPLHDVILAVRLKSLSHPPTWTLSPAHRCPVYRGLNVKGEKWQFTFLLLTGQSSTLSISYTLVLEA